MRNDPDTPQKRREGLTSSLNLLMRYEPEWAGPDLTRGKATMENLLKQMDEIDRRARR